MNGLAAHRCSFIFLKDLAMISRTHRNLLLVAWLAVALAAAGCGGSDQGPAGSGGTGEVSGTILFADGKQLPGGWIAFHGPDASAVVLVPVDAGKFSARQVPAGEEIAVTVDIDGAAAKAAALDERIREAVERSALMKQAGKDNTQLQKQIEEMQTQAKRLHEMEKALKGLPVNKKYTQRQTTPLKVRVVEGSQTIDFKLEP
jgi:hypothetical protein